MRKMLFFALLFSAISCFAEALQNDNSIQSTITDSIQGKSQSEVDIVTNATKAEGDSAYKKSNFDLASKIYESVLRHGESADLYYNLGNSYYKAGEIAKAVLNYERALLLQPGNGDIRANLEIARAKTIDKVDPVPEIFFISWIKAIVNSMNIDAWGSIGISAFVLFIVTLCLFIFSKQIILKKTGFIAGILFLIIALCANIFAHQLKQRLVNRDQAIVTTASVAVRSTPSESGTSLFILHEGRKVFIKDNSMNEWKEIRLEDGKVGWVPISSIEMI